MNGRSGAADRPMLARMKTLLVLLVLLGHARAEPAPPVREPHSQGSAVELAIGGAPTGRIGMRAHVAIGPTRVVVGGGFGLTGAIGSVAIEQPIHRQRVPSSRWNVTQEWSAYAAYSVGWLASWNREPFGGHESRLHDGRYHWLEVGGVVRIIGERWFLGLGFGVTFLVDSPDPLGDEELFEDEGTLWWLTPEGWTRQKGWGPVLWSSVGVRL